MDKSKNTVAFPPLETAEHTTAPSFSSSPLTTSWPHTYTTYTAPAATSSSTRPRHASSKSVRSHTESITSSINQKIRRASQSFEESHPPEGFLAATGALASSIVSAADTSRLDRDRAHPQATGTKSSTPSPTLLDGGYSPGALLRSASGHAVTPQGMAMQSKEPSRSSSGSEVGMDASVVHTNGSPEHGEKGEASAPLSAAATQEDPGERAALKAAAGEVLLTEPYENGYHFPPRHSWQESTKLGSIAFWNYFTTPLGFFVVLYGLNVVAWGGMLFLLLCNASPAMCYPSCEDINSPRRKWIEWDSQILNALFCVTGFGLAPWRFRDLYYLLKFRLGIDRQAIRRLAGIHRGWFRLPGSQELPIHIGPENITDLQSSVPAESIPIPAKSIPNAPLTAVRAPATATWKMDYVIWFAVFNTFLQVVLSAFMWSMDRYTRPPWSTGLFVALACIAAAVSGLKIFTEGKRVKSIEGVPISDKDLERLEKDKELGITHYNNIKDKKPKEKAAKKNKFAKGGSGAVAK